MEGGREQKVEAETEGKRTRIRMLDAGCRIRMRESG